MKTDEQITNHFNNLILDELKDFDCWVVGGSILSYIDDRRIGDIDIYFRNELEREKCFDYLTSNNAIISSDNVNTTRVLYKNKTIDLLKFYHKTPQECADDCDFSVCGISTDGVSVYKTSNFYDDWRKKSLVYNNFHSAPQQLHRMQKYLMRGYRMDRKETLKLVNKLRECTEEEIHNYLVLRI